MKEIKPANRWNMDEAGIMEGQGQNGLVLGSAATHTVFRKGSGIRVWTSFIECISETGQSLSPLVIFKGKTVQQQWFPTDLGLELFKEADREIGEGANVKKDDYTKKF